MVKQIKFNRLKLLFVNYLKENITKRDLTTEIVTFVDGDLVNILFYTGYSKLRIHYNRIIKSCCIDDLTKELVTESIIEVYSLQNYKIDMDDNED